MHRRLVRQIGCLLLLPVFLAAHLVCHCGKLAEASRSVAAAEHACCSTKQKQAPVHEKHDADCGHCGVKSQSIMAERSVAPIVALTCAFDLPMERIELPELAPVSRVVHSGEWGAHGSEPPIEVLLAKCVLLI